jgi:hypothetical protein
MMRDLFEIVIGDPAALVELVARAPFLGSVDVRPWSREAGLTTVDQMKGNEIWALRVGC